MSWNGGSSGGGYMPKMDSQSIKMDSKSIKMDSQSIKHQREQPDRNSALQNPYHHHIDIKTSEHKKHQKHKKHQNIKYYPYV